MFKYTGAMASSVLYFLNLLFFLAAYEIYPSQNLQHSLTTLDIKGYVHDKETGEALNYANVSIKGTLNGAVTNNRGYFIIVDVNVDSTILVVSYIGYKTEEILLDKIKNLSDPLEIELSPGSYQSDEVVVVADGYKIWKTADEVSQVTISPKQIEMLPQIGEVDIFRSLQLLPGISAINDGSAGLYIRGGTPDQNLTLLDGMTIYHVDHFFGFFSAFNANAIKDVQVYKGGFGAKYGGRLSSVVDLTGKTGDVNNFKMSLGASLLSVNGVAQIPLGGKGSILISARRSYVDFINSGAYDTIYGFLTGEDQSAQTQAPGGGGGGPRGVNMQQESVQPSFYYYDLNVKGSYQLGVDDFVALTFYSSKDFLDESQGEESFTSFRGNENGTRTRSDLTDWGNIGSSLKWSRRWSDRFYSDIILSYSDYNSNNNFMNDFQFNVVDDSSSFLPKSFSRIEDNTINDLTLRIDNDWVLHKDHKISLGGTVTSINTSYNFTVNDTLSIVNRQGDAFQTVLYLQDKWKLLDNLEVNLGIRSTHYSATSKIYVEPRASFIYSFNNMLKLKGAFGDNYQFINQITNEDVLEGSREFWMLADESLQPGFSRHYILGLEYTTAGYLFSIEGYYKELENLLEFSQRTQRDPRSIIANSENYTANFFMGDGISKGIEFLAQKRFGSLSGWVSYTLGKVDYTFPDFNDGNPFPATQDRRHEFKVIGTYKVGKWYLSATWIYASGQAYTAPESQYYITLLDGQSESYIHVSDKNAYRLPDYHRLDLSAAFNFTTKSFGGQFGLSIFNAYNNENVWYRKYDLESAPIVVTDVTMLGITPTLFFKINF